MTRSTAVHAPTALLAWSIASGAAFATTLDIDPLVGMPNAPGLPIRVASQVSDQFLPQAVLISSTAPFAAVVHGIGVHWFPDPVLQNGLGGATTAGTLSYVASVFFAFVDPASPGTTWTTTSFSLYTDYLGDGGFCSLVAYDVNGAVVDIDAKNEHTGSAPTGTQYSVAAAGIAKVEFIGAGTQAVSNIVFDEPAPATCAADLTGDGAVDGADLGVLLGAWGTTGGSPSADLSGDGTVDGADLGMLLGAWGPCG